jgi:hypothetical protein
MGGGNAQKSATARLKNMKDAGKTPEERKAASAKAAADSTAFVCIKCRNTFMVNVKPPTLYLHATQKHPELKPVECFSQLKDFDPEDPKGLKKAAADKAAAALKPPMKKKKPTEGLDDLLSAGLAKPAKPAKKK